MPPAERTPPASHSYISKDPAASRPIRAGGPVGGGAVAERNRRARSRSVRARESSIAAARARTLKSESPSEGEEEARSARAGGTGVESCDLRASLSASSSRPVLAGDDGRLGPDHAPDDYVGSRPTSGKLGEAFVRDRFNVGLFNIGEPQTCKSLCNIIIYTCACIHIATSSYVYVSIYGCMRVLHICMYACTNRQIIDQMHK